MQAARSTSPDLTGTTIGNYQLSHRLGVGGMGEVWQAYKLSVHEATKQVAVKLLHDSFGQNPLLREMFFSEAQLAMQINNGNTVQVFEVDESESGRCYMVMEWVDGLNLRQLCAKLRARGERLPLDLVAYIIGEVLKALICIHDFIDHGEAKTIVHRDVTPENVMLSVWGGVKLMDFGIARLSSDESEEFLTKGKLAYMAPEQLAGEPCTPAMDLFALGGILHELLDGESFRGGVIPAQLEEQVGAGLVPPLRDPGRVPAELAALREGLLTPELGARIGSAREAYIQLRLWPGCHDAQFDLERLVREFAPPGVARELDAATKIESISSLELVTWTDIDPSARPSPPALPPPLKPSPRAALQAPSPTPRRQRALLPVLASAVVVLLGAAAVALALSGRLPQLPLEPLPPLEPLEEPAAVAAPELERARWPSWSQIPARAQPSDLSVESEDPEPGEASPRALSSLRAVRITLPAGSSPGAELRIRGRVHALDVGGTQLRLRAGRYAVDFRASPTTAWLRSGELRVSAYRPNRVAINAAGKLVRED